ncbi:MAG: amidohydrolase [Lysobacterales bacterium]
MSSWSSTRYAALAGCLLAVSQIAAASELEQAISKDYDQHLGPLFKHFHANPELSFMEMETAGKLAGELRELGYEVTEGVGKTGLVALLKNGPGPMVMMRADMDGLPVEELTDLPYKSTVVKENSEGQSFPVMHACGHDVHVTALIGTARQMVANRDQWSGTLMLVGQPAEEWKISGAKTMREDQIWERFGQPDYALAFHVSAELEAGKVYAAPSAAYSGVDSVDIIVRGIGAHGASPHRGKDPVVVGAQIVLALQTLVSRELSPREPGVVTVGVFRAGNKRNVISEEARLEVTVRSDTQETRTRLLDGISRIAEHVGRAAGLPEDRLPIVENKGTLPVTLNHGPLVDQLNVAWRAELGEEILVDYDRQGMGGEDFPYFTNDPAIPSVYFQVGGTPAEDFAREAAGGAPVPSHHSPLFRISPEPAVRSGVAATVVALQELMPVSN